MTRIVWDTDVQHRSEPAKYMLRLCLKPDEEGAVRFWVYRNHGRFPVTIFLGHLVAYGVGAKPSGHDRPLLAHRFQSCRLCLRRIHA